MRALLVLCLAGCGFEVDASSGGPPTDARPDAARQGCNVGTGTPAVAGTVGLSSGGGNHGSIACPTGEVLIGVAFDMSNGPANGQPSRSARGIRISCATLAIDAVGAHTGLISERSVDGFGGAGWTPSTWTAPALCPAGGVVNKLAAHGGSRPQDLNLFMDTSIACALIDAGGRITQGPDIAISDATTGTGENPTSVTCPAGAQIVGIATDSGAGLDTVEVSCAPITCTPSS